jgi:hypothetical protein
MTAPSRNRETGVPTASFATTMQVMAIYIIANVPLFLWGDPGQGKSKTIENIGRTLSIWVETISTLVREAASFGGTPVYDAEDKALTLHSEAWAHRLNDHATELVEGTDQKRGAIAFLDELNLALEDVQAAAMRFTQERYVGEFQVDETVRMIAAGNPSNTAAVIRPVPLPLLNRFGHLEFKMDGPTLQRGFAGFWPTLDLVAPSPERVEAELQKIMATIGAFLGRRDDMITILPKETESINGKAYPTPRSWENAGRLYAVAKAIDADETVINVLMSSIIGHVAAGELIEFIEHLDLPDPEDILANPASFTIDSNRLDQVYVTLASVWNATQRNNTPERWIACGRVIEAVARANQGDIAYLYAREWSADGNRPFGAMPDADSIEAIMPILTGMGLALN